MRIIPNGADHQFRWRCHLHIRPDQLADKIVMMGDPDRVTMTTGFDHIECDVTSREFHSVTEPTRAKELRHSHMALN